MVNNDPHQTARELVRRYAVSLERFPNHPALTHVCRIRAETGYALFAEIADLLSFNPSTTAPETTLNKRMSPQAVVEHLCGYGSRAAAPRPFLCMADTTHTGSGAGESENFATPYEFRARIFTSLGMGAKGLVYRHNDMAGRSISAQRLNPTIPGLNAEIGAVRELLAIAAPLPGSVRVKGWEALKAYPLLAGDKALVIILVRQEETETKADPGTQVGMEVDLPTWASVKRVTRAAWDGLVPISVEATDRPLTFSVPLPEAADILVVEF